MSFSGLFAIGVSGVNAFSQSLEAISSNIANSQTDGYRRARVDFSTLLGDADAAVSTTVGSGRVGAGVASTGFSFVDEQGAIIRTDNEGDLAISGDGFFVVRDESLADSAANDDALLFTRAGAFRLNANGDLVNAGGLSLQGVPVGASGTTTIAQSLNGLETVNINRQAPGLATTSDVVGFDIDSDGFVTAQYADGTAARIFRVPIARFRNENGLERTTETTFLNTEQSGDAILRAAGDQGAGLIEVQAREASTVDIGEEFGRLIETQRAYQTNARVLSIADELWQRTIDTAA